MKRYVLLCILLFVTSFAFSDQVGRFDFAAYYNGRGNQAKWIELNIYDGTSSSQTNAGIINLVDPHVLTEQGVSYEEQTVFIYEIQGNYDNRLYIEIKFLPLQAYVNDTYYIPKHEFIVSETSFAFNSLLENGDNPLTYLHDNILLKYKEGGTEGPKSVLFQKIHGDNPYPTPDSEATDYSKGKTIQFFGGVCLNSNDKTPGSNTIYSSIPWTRRGQCKLIIREDEEINGEYTYVSDVKVTLYFN